MLDISASMMTIFSTAVGEAGGDVVVAVGEGGVDVSVAVRVGGGDVAVIVGVGEAGRGDAVAGTDSVSSDFSISDTCGWQADAKKTRNPIRIVEERQPRVRFVVICSSFYLLGIWTYVFNDVWDCFVPVK